jgi:hypothetical protein
MLHGLNVHVPYPLKRRVHLLLEGSPEFERTPAFLRNTGSLNKKQQHEGRDGC